MRLLDRYVLMKFFIPFIYCFVGFLSIWLVFDLSDNGPDFIEAHTPLKKIVEYYQTQIPEIIVISLPIGELLALLYALTQMSRSNEIVSMLTAGVSVGRIIVPLVLVGMLLTGITQYFNYEMSPHAAAEKKQMLREIKRGKKIEPGLTGHLFRNRENFRTWYMRKIHNGKLKQYLEDVQVIQQDANGNITDQLYAREAYFNPTSRVWTFFFVKYVKLDDKGEMLQPEYSRKMDVSNWSETPWRIASSVMNPDYLSVDELKLYLTYNSDFPKKRLAPYETQLYYRWALPWVCLLAIFLAAPLGIVYSRRGILGGVASAIALFFSLVFISSLFVTLGKGDKINPFVAAWGPMVVYFAIGLTLTWMKSTNRELPKIPGI
ncbi:MAG: LptF/LptG family permease [Chthoniobacterales bacterium]